MNFMPLIRKVFKNDYYKDLHSMALYGKVIQLKTMIEIAILLNWKSQLLSK